MAYTRRHQVYAVKESQEGVYNAPSPSGLRLVHDPVLTPDFEMAERNMVAESLSTEPSELARAMLGWTFGVDFGPAGSTGTPAVPVVPLWALFLKACGMQEIRLKSLTIEGTTPTITNTIPHGSTIVDSVTNARGRVVGTYSGTGHTKVIYEPIDLMGAGGPENLKHFAAASTATADNSPAGSFVISATDLEQEEGYVYRPIDHICWTVDTTGAWGTRTATPWEVMLGGTSGATGLLLRPVDELAGATTLKYEPQYGTFSGEAIATNIAPYATNTLASGGSPHSNYTLSLASIFDNHLFASRGARGNWKLEARAGQPMRLQFDMKGLEWFINDLPSHTFNAPTQTTASRFASANLTVAGLAMRLAGFDFDMGANLAIRDDPSFAYGAMSYRVTGRDPGGSIDPELTSLLSHDFWGRWKAATGNAIQWRIGTAETALGTASHDVGGTLWLDVGNAQYDPVTIGDRDGIATAAASYKARRVDWYGEDEVRIYVL